MSAFIVEDSTINKVVTFLGTDSDIGYTCRRLGMQVFTDEGRRDLAQRLFNMNCEAVDYRYGKGESEKFRPLDFKYREENSIKKLWVYKALNCLMYQCSEGKVPDSPLYKQMEEIQSAIAHSIVCALPEYERATWG
jgi:hypothetical protein